MNWYKISQKTKINPKDLVFDNQHVTSHHNQNDYRLFASYQGEEMGWISYSVFEGKVSINNVEVPNEENQRRGVASALQYQLQRIFPNKEIQHGLMSDGGEGLWNSLNKNVVQNEEYHKLKAEEKKLKREKNFLDGIYEQMSPHNERTPEQKEEMARAGEKLNAITDRLYDIEKDLWGMKASHTYLVTE